MTRYPRGLPGRSFHPLLAGLLLTLVSVAWCAEEEVVLAKTDAWLAALPRDGFDVEALGAKLKTPAEAYAFVRDQVAYEPYTGVMKGAAGALLTRGANDCDRALLLARLLAAQGVDAHLVRGVISAQTARHLADQIVTRPGAVDLMLTGLPASPVAPSTNFNGRVEEKLFSQRVADRGRMIADAEAGQRTLVAAAVPTELRAAPSYSTDHVWVQATVNGQTVDFDPSADGDKSGATLCTVVDNWDPGSLPDELFQTLQIRVMAEWLKDGALEAQELFANDSRVVDRLARGLRIAIVPASANQGPNSYVPILLAGEEEIDGTVFHFRAGDKPADASPNSGFGGLGFGGAPAPEEKPAAIDPNAPKLARLWIEVRFHAPGSSDGTVRRVVLDRVEAAGAKWQLIAALSEDASVGGLLVQAWDAALDVGAPNPLAIMEAESAALRTLAPAQAAMAEKKTVNAGDLPGLAPSPQLLGFFLASGLKHHQLAGAGARSIHLRPRLAFQHHGFTLADWTQPESRQLRYEEGIDLVNAPFRFIGEATATRTLALRAGLNDTALEQFTESHASSFNTFPFMAAAREKKLAILTIAEPEQLKQLTVPPAIRAVLAGELADGRVLVLPTQPVAMNDTHVFGWWSIDPATGYAIGKMELGGAQALTEKAQTEEKVSEWTQTYVKIMGDALKCFEGEVTKAVKQDVKAAVFGGEAAKTPDAGTMASCLRDAACDALKDYVSGHISSAVAEREAKALQDLLFNWMRQKAIDQAEAATTGGCQSLLGGGS